MKSVENFYLPSVLYKCQNFEHNSWGSSVQFWYCRPSNQLSLTTIFHGYYINFIENFNTPPPPPKKERKEKKKKKREKWSSTTWSTHQFMAVIEVWLTLFKLIKIIDSSCHQVSACLKQFSTTGLDRNRCRLWQGCQEQKRSTPVEQHVSDSAVWS